MISILFPKKLLVCALRFQLHAQTEANPESYDSNVTDINEIHPMLSEDITIGDDSPMLNNESEELTDEFAGLSDDPYAICPSEMASNFFRFSTRLSSLTDALIGSDMDTEEPRVMVKVALFFLQ